VLQPFREEGIILEFYRVLADLSIDLDAFVHLAETLRPSGLLFINYFGFPVDKASGKIIREIKQYCWVVEDCAQGSLIEQEEPIVGSIGSFVLTSFRKYLPVPDGGLFINRTEMTWPSLSPANNEFVRYRLLGKLLRHEFLQSYSTNKVDLETAYLSLFAAAERQLDTSIPLQGISQTSQRLLGTIDLAEAMARRRRNYSFLLQAFLRDSRLRSIGSPVLADLPYGVSPLVFPIRTEGKRRNVLRQELMARRVFCPIHWDLPIEIQQDRFVEANQLSCQILGLPIDQRYNHQDMETLIDRLIEVQEVVT
jgi:dTDP-4-amino-4,6-dideoxygalactose transaminase